jgi:NAD(P)-dependent dehydrogenase (short-subunit alcohol dehydrogenase family)
VAPASARAARDSAKPVLGELEKTHGVRRYACGASEPAAVEQLFQDLVRDLGAPTLVVHNIDGRMLGIFRKGITEADPILALETIRNAAFSAFLVGQQAARLMRGNSPDSNGAKGTIIFTNARAALKGFALSAAFAMACQAKSGLTGAEHGAGADAAGDPRGQCPDRRRDRLDAGGRHASRRRPRCASRSAPRRGDDLVFQLS